MADGQMDVIDLETASVESLINEHGLSVEAAKSMLAYKFDMYDLIDIDAETVDSLMSKGYEREEATRLLMHVVKD